MYIFHTQLFELLHASQCLVTLLGVGCHEVQLPTRGIEVLLQLLHFGSESSDLLQGTGASVLLLTQPVVAFCGAFNWLHKHIPLFELSSSFSVCFLHTLQVVCVAIEPSAGFVLCPQEAGRYG